MLLHSDTNNFNNDVMNSKHLVLVDFFATWCGPCQMVGPIVEQLSEEVPNVKFVKVDVDENTDIARQYRVISVPTFVLIRDGQAVKTEVGALPKSALQKMLAQA